MKNIHIDSELTTIKSSSLLLQSLETIFSKLKDNGNYSKFKCFVKFLNFFHSESNKYFLPFAPYANTSVKITQFTSMIQITENKLIEQSFEKNNDDFCKYISGLYSVCVEAHTNLNLAIYELENNENNSYFKEVDYTFCKHIPYFVDMTRDNPHFRILYNMAVSVKFHCQHLTIGENAYHFKRLIYMTMMTLNDLNISACGPPKYNFMWFNNFDFQRIRFVSQLVDTMNSLKFRLTADDDQTIGFDVTHGNFQHNIIIKIVYC